MKSLYSSSMQETARSLTPASLLLTYLIKPQAIRGPELPAG